MAVDLSHLSDADLDRLIATRGASSPSQKKTPGSFDPAQATDAQLNAYIADNRPMGGAEDVGRSAMGGLANAVASIPTAARNVADAGQALGQKAMDFAVRQGWVPPGAQIPSAGSLLAPHGAPSLADLVQGVVRHGAELAHVNPAIARGALTVAAPATALSGPSAEQTATGLNGGVPVHRPQTTAGRYAQRVAEMAPMALAPGNALQRAANVVVPGVASRAAEDIAPDNLKPASAKVGALAGGGAVGVARRLTEAPQAALGRVIEGLSPEDMQSAQELRQRMAAQGLDLTLPEAVQQVTNNGTGLGRMQRVIESTRQGQQLTAPYFSERPQQVSQAVRSLADMVAAPTDRPSMIGVNAQDAAVSALNRARKTVNSIADPDYAALQSQAMEPEAYRALSANRSYSRALAALRGDPELGAEVESLPDNNLAVVNEVMKRLQVGADQAAGTPLNPGDNHLATLRTNSRQLADELARGASDQFGNARDTVAALSRQYVDPLRAGPVGVISGTDSVPAQTSALYPRNPLEGAPPETAQGVQVLNMAQPGIANDLTRQHLINALNESGRQLQGGQNQYSGAKFAAMVAGNPEQEATLSAGISALPQGSGTAASLADLLEGLRATGKRQQPGSMTAFNSSDLNDLHIAPYANALGRITDPLEWGKGIGDILNRANYSRNVRSLADMIMSDPNDTQAILQGAQGAAQPSLNTLPVVVTQSRDRRQ